MKLSTIIIARNEEEVIKRCLESVKTISDEIIVVDNASTDDTSKIAKQFGVKIVSTDKEDFSKLRNLGLEKAKGTWILYIDADEVVSEKLAQELKHVLSGKNEYVAYFLKRKEFYLGNHQWPTIEKHKRFFKKSSLKRWEGVLHESSVVQGEVSELDGYLLHYTHRSLRKMVEKTIRWSGVEAELRYKANHPPVTWWRILRVMVTAFFTSYITQKGWKVGTVGVIESVYQTFSIFITYARLWEMQHLRDKNKVK